MSGPTLFHFTAEHHLTGGPGHPGPGILRTGLAGNHHPLLSLPAHVWLTEDASFDQVWSPRPVRLPDGSTCDRTEVRLTLGALPRWRWDHTPALLPYRSVRQFVRPDWLTDFEGGADLSAWWVFIGHVRPDLILAVEHRSAVAA